MTCTSRWPVWDSVVARQLVTAVAERHAGPVLMCLQAIQGHFGYVPEGATPIVADVCNVSRADVHGVLTFYADLRTSPPPPVPVRLCAAEACQAVGARALKGQWQATCELDAELAALTGIDEPIFCLGNCALGPAAVVDGELMGRVSVERLRAAVLARAEQDSEQSV